MSEGTFVGNLWDAVSAPFQDKPTTPTLQAPNALSQTPTQADASKPAAKQNLADEQQIASTSTVVNSGGNQGLMTTPDTTSRSLMGS